MNEILNHIADLLVADRKEEAERQLRALATAEVQDPRIHLRVADLAEELGLTDLIARELNLALRDAPDDLDTLKRLAHLHADAGHTERAARYWRIVAERAPEDVEAWEELGSLLVQLARSEEARQTYQRALEATGDRRFQAHLKSLERGEIPAGGVEEGPDEEEGFPSEAALSRFVSLFSGREGVYARQWANRQGESGYTPIREPFNHQVARNHLLGNLTVGIYPIRLDDTVTFAAIDLDLRRYVVSRSRPGDPEWDEAMARLFQYARLIAQRAREKGLDLYLEESGLKGCHLWIFFSEPLPARLGRRLALELCRAAGATPTEVHIDVFPRQSRVSTGGLGNLIKLPLGIHRATGRRALFLDEEGRPITDWEPFLLAIRRTSKEAVIRYLEQTPPPPEEPKPREDDRSTPPPVEPVREYHPEEDPELQLILSRCATLRALLAKAEQDNDMTHDEARVLIHSVGHLENGPLAVNSYLRRCPGLDPGLQMKSRLRGNPISCPKIRSRIPHITSTVPCNCEFPETGLYPTPLLHLRVVSHVGPEDVDTLQFQALVTDFLRARKALHDAQRHYERLSSRLGEWFDRAGIDEFRIPMGKLVRIPGKDGPATFRLEV